MANPSPYRSTSSILNQDIYSEKGSYDGTDIAMQWGGGIIVGC